MSRRSRKSKDAPAPIYTQQGLEMPFPASPGRPPKGGIYIYRGSQYINYFNFYALYAMHAFVMAATEKGAFDWEGEDMMFEEFTLTTRDNGQFTLRMAYDYKPTAKEKEWQLPENYTRFFGPPPVPRQHEEPRKTAKDRIELPAGSIPLTDLATDASAARQALRKAGIKIPGARWIWPPDHPDLIKVKKLLQSVTK